MAENAGEWHKTLAGDVAKYSGAELDGFLDESKSRHGMYVIDVSGPENLPADSFLHR